MKHRNKKKNWFLGVFIFSGFCIIAFDYNFSNDSFRWFWKGKEQVAIVLGLITIIFGSLWKFEQRKEKSIENGN